MAKGVRRTKGEVLVQYSTKVTEHTRQLLDALAKGRCLAYGHTGGQRELLEEMTALYMKTFPEATAKAKAIMEVLGIDVEPAAVEEVEPVADPVGPALVMTVRYVGSDKVHLYDPDAKNSVGCGLAGEMDIESILEQSPSAVDCKKCRYCRKAEFVGVPKL